MIRIETEFSNPNLPDGRSAREIILASASLRSWWQVDPATVALASGAVSSIASLGGASPATLTQATAARRPTYGEAALASRFPLANFDGVDDMLQASELPYSPTGAWSWAWLGTVGALAADQHLAAVWLSSGNGTRLRMTAAGVVNMQHGGGSIDIAPAVPFGAPLLIIGSSTGSSLKLTVNGAAATAGTTNNVSTATQFRLGAANNSGLQPAAMGLADMLIWQRDILADAALVEAIEAMAAIEYGVTLV